MLSEAEGLHPSDAGLCTSLPVFMVSMSVPEIRQGALALAARVRAGAVPNSRMTYDNRSAGLPSTSSAVPSTVNAAVGAGSGADGSRVPIMA